MDDCGHTNLATAETRPRYGGTLRVMLQSSPQALDLPANATPSEYWDLARTLSLIGDTLVKLDAQDRPQPGLAVAWQSDPSGPALAIHAAPRSEVPRRQRGIARGHRADSRRTPSQLECACIGGFTIHREREGHAFAARRTRAAAQSVVQAQ